MVHVSCESCGAPIRWVRTRSGKSMPLDAVAVEDGNVQLDEQGIAVVFATSSAPGPGQRYVSHFASCPNAATHRRSR